MNDLEREKAIDRLAQSFFERITPGLWAVSPWDHWASEETKTSFRGAVRAMIQYDADLLRRLLD